MKRLVLFLITLLSISMPCPSVQKNPSLIIVFIIDQFASYHLKQLIPYMDGGIRFLYDNGVVYSSAFMPHGAPDTAIGHALLSTGTVAANHGIVAFSWVDRLGNKIMCDQSSLLNNDLILEKGPYNLMAPALSDQFIKEKKGKAFALSFKSHAATFLAGKRGKAIWFDKEKAAFRSSVAYFNQLPDWVISFNDFTLPLFATNFDWQLKFQRSSEAYQFNYIDNYDYARFPSLINREERVYEFEKKGMGYKLYYHPRANKVLLNLAQTCLAAECDQQNEEPFLLWISISSPDKIGHIFGPDSLEKIDMLYQLDSQLQNFIDYVYDHYKKEEVLFVLTADHGAPRLPELLQQEGKSAGRVLKDQLKDELNMALKNTFNIISLISHIEKSQIYLDQEKFLTFSDVEQHEILELIKKLLLHRFEVKRVWTVKDLLCQEQREGKEKWYADQLYPGRHGEIVYQLKSHYFLTGHEKGIKHNSPYRYDREVPMIWCWEGNINPDKIDEKISMLYFAPTLARFMGVKSDNPLNIDLIENEL